MTPLSILLCLAVSSPSNATQCPSPKTSQLQNTWQWLNSCVPYWLACNFVLFAGLTTVLPQSQKSCPTQLPRRPQNGNRQSVSSHQCLSVKHIHEPCSSVLYSVGIWCRQGLAELPLSGHRFGRHLVPSGFNHESTQRYALDPMTCID